MPITGFITPDRRVAVSVTATRLGSSGTYATSCWTEPLRQEEVELHQGWTNAAFCSAHISARA